MPPELVSLPPWLTPALALAAALLAWRLTGWLRQRALARQQLDIPNARSSHTRPTPRGGGLAFVIAFLLAVPLAAWTGLLQDQPQAAWAVGGAGLMVAVVGWLDDRRPLPARWRLPVHVLAGAWALAWLGGAPALSLAGIGWQAGAAVGALILVLYATWMLNLSNFMDGIDGLASLQAITVAGSAALVCALPGGEPALAVLPLLLAGSVAGFLPWNFPPARIFMGDAGSGFLGIVMAALSMQAGWVRPELFWVWVILSAVFVSDATLTLLRRLSRGEPVYQAHRLHAYQHQARRYGAHRPVTLAITAINLMWLLPLAWLVAAGRLPVTTGLLLAYGPVVLLAWRCGAGRPE